MKDHSVHVLHAASQKAGRAAIGTLANWANHPGALGSPNQSLSGDYCDGLYRKRNILIRNNLFADCT